MEIKRFKKYFPTSLATFLMFGVTGLFFAFPGRHLGMEISPILLGYIGGVFIFVFINYFMTGATDPGTYPKRTEPEDDEDELRAPVYVTVLIHDISVRMKWCSTCNFYRPPRVSHCSVCNNCIDKFDHHCPWVNNCIGRRNYHYFFSFLMLLSLHMMNVFGFSLWVVIMTKGVEEIKEIFGVSIAVMVIDGLLFFPVFGLFVFHITLVARGRTTNEQVTGKFRSGVNPFDNGCQRNCYSALCSAQIPKYINRYDAVDYTKYTISPPYTINRDSLSVQDVNVFENGGNNPITMSPSSVQSNTSHVKSNGSEHTEAAATVSNVPEVKVLPRNGSLRQELDPNRFRAKVTPVHATQTCQPTDAIALACMEVTDDISENERQNYEMTVLREDEQSGGESPCSQSSSTTKLMNNLGSARNGSQRSKPEDGSREKYDRNHERTVSNSEEVSNDNFAPSQAAEPSGNSIKQIRTNSEGSQSSEEYFGRSIPPDDRSPLSNENNCNNSSVMDEYAIPSLSEVCESGYVSTYNSTEQPVKDVDLTNKIELENAMRDIEANVALLQGAESAENLKNGKSVTSEKVPSEKHVHDVHLRSPDHPPLKQLGRNKRPLSGSRQQGRYERLSGSGRVSLLVGKFEQNNEKSKVEVQRSKLRGRERHAASADLRHSVPQFTRRNNARLLAS